MKVLLFGATGLLGSTIHKTLIDRGITVLAPNREIIDLLNPEHLRTYLTELNFDVLINAAACSKTDWCEDHKEECFTVNWISPTIMARYAKEKHAIFVHFSTDYVFDGNKKEYFEEDATSPLSVYGLSKEYGERSIGRIGGNHYIVRTSLLYKEGGNNFLSRIPEMIQSSKEIVCTKDLISAPTYSPYLAEATLKLIDANPPYGIYHISGGYPMNACEFAKTFAEIMEKRVNIKEALSTELNRKAKRPQNSFLNNFKFLSLVGFAPEKPEVYMRRIYEKLYKRQA